MLSNACQAGQALRLYMRATVFFCPLLQFFSEDVTPSYACSSAQRGPHYLIMLNKTYVFYISQDRFKTDKNRSMTFSWLLMQKKNMGIPDNLAPSARAVCATLNSPRFRR